VRETRVTVDDLIYPMFVTHGETTPIPSMPGISRYSIDDLCREVEQIVKLRIPAVMLFGIPEKKDERGSEAYAKDGIVPRAVRALKKAFSDSITVITDVCLCEYTSHGHCGVIEPSRITEPRRITLRVVESDEGLRAGMEKELHQATPRH